MISPVVIRSTLFPCSHTYRHPATRQTHSYIMPLTNGICTLTQSFAGTDNGVAVSATDSQTFRIHTFLAESITSETDNDGYVYNPSGIPVGGTAKFKVSLDPMTGFTEDDIKWDGSGVTFVNNDNTGPEITVQGGSVGLFLLAPSVTGLRLLPSPLLHGNVMTPTTAPVTVWIVRDNYGNNAPITQSAIQPIIDDANKILRQKALTLNWSGTANYTNKTVWQDITNVLSPTNAALNALLNCTNSTGGVEIYFVKTLTDGSKTLNGVNDYRGLALAQGAGQTGAVLAHEVGHQCGLLDIYVSSENVSISVSGIVSQPRLPSDWGGGYYPKDLTQAELVRRLIMHGESSLFAPQGLDLPSGRVYGLCYTNAPATGEQIWHLKLQEVGQSDISDQTPNHH